jgi:UTP:GlnB (protein PII) uridylyltransferase
VKNLNQIKSLGDVRTTISTHSGSVPMRKESVFLRVNQLNKERQLLETKLFWLSKSQRQIEVKLSEIRSALEKMMSLLRQEELNSGTVQQLNSAAVQQSNSLVGGDSLNNKLDSVLPELKKVVVGY